jgi:myo-inositol 2-dehydrogenase/D-chiro-inositol 1-dehydrogenase
MGYTEGAYTMRVGVIGTGGMGQLHARHVAGSGRHMLAGVMDVDRTRAEAAAAGHDGCAVFADGAELVNDPRVEAVIVATPDSTHAPLVLECLRAGKPVLVEKPLAPTPEEARSVVEAEVAGGRKLIQVGFMRLYDPAHLELRRAIDDGIIGRLLLFRGWHRNPFPEPALTRRETLVSSAVHDFMTARWLFGAEPVSVSSVGPDPSRGLDDPGLIEVVTLTFEGGGVAIVEANLVAYAYEVGVEVVGDRAIVTTPLPQAAIVRRGASASQAVDRSWKTRFVPAYRTEVDEWLAGVAAGRDPQGPSAWDGYATLAVAAAAVRSVADGKPVAVDRMPKPSFYA